LGPDRWICEWLSLVFSLNYTCSSTYTKFLILGKGKEFIGGLIGNESLKAQGRAQYDDGLRRETSGQANDLIEGMGNRVAGSLGALASTDEKERERFSRQHDEGKAAIRSVQYDLQRKAEADGKNVQS